MKIVSAISHLRPWEMIDAGRIEGNIRKKGGTRNKISSFCNCHLSSEIGRTSIISLHFQLGGPIRNLNQIRVFFSSSPGESPKNYFEPGIKSRRLIVANGTPPSDETARFLTSNFETGGRTSKNNLQGKIPQEPHTLLQASPRAAIKRG